MRSAHLTLIACGLAAALAAPSTASAADGISYGGATLVPGGRLAATSISLLQHPDGRLTGRVALGYHCHARRANYLNVVIRLSGAVGPQGFTARGSTRLTGGGRLHLRLRGALDGVTATGTARFRTSKLRGCRGYRRGFALRADRAPAGGPAGPRAGTLLAGFTTQTAGGIRLPVALRVTRSGRRVAALWQATMRCGPRAVLTLVNSTPSVRVRPDGTFRRGERFKIRYVDGTVERYRVFITGRFLADGAVGTLRARMRISKPGKRYYPCNSQTQRWTASG